MGRTYARTSYSVRSSLERLRQLLGPIRAAHPRPGDEVGARRDRRRRVELEEGQVAHEVQKVGRAIRVQQLGADRDPPSLGLAQPVDGHARERIVLWLPRSSSV